MVTRTTIHLAPYLYCPPLGPEDQRTCTRAAFDRVREHLEACRQHPDYRFVLSGAECLKGYLAVHSEEREFLRELAAAGRLQGTGSYGEPDELNLGGEAMIRSLVHGRLCHAVLLGAEQEICVALGSCAHPLQLAQIAAQAGFEGMVWPQDAVGAPALRFALAPDGTRLLIKAAHQLGGLVLRDRGQRPAGGGAEDLLELLRQLPPEAASPVSQDLVMLDGEAAPPGDWLGPDWQELAKRDPAVVVSTPHRYFAALKPEVQSREAEIPVRGRSRSWSRMARLVSRPDLKIASRIAENRLLNAEKWATLAGLLGARYPDAALDKAWRQVLFGQNPEAIGGTSADVPFLDTLAGYREALELAAEVEGKALSCIAGMVDVRRGRGLRPEVTPLVVFNPLGWERTDVCRARVSLDGPLAAGFKLLDDRGRPVPVQLAFRSDGGEVGSEEPWAEAVFIARGVPSVGYRVYYLAPAAEMPPMGEPAEQSEPEIKNEHFVIRASAALGGALTSIYDRRARREVLNAQAGPANEIVALAEQADRETSAWELMTTGVASRSSQRQARVWVSEGPVFSQIRISSELPAGQDTGGPAQPRCGIHQQVTLYANLRRIELRTRLERYRGEHELLALVFPVAIAGGVPTSEDSFAAVVGKRGCGRLEFRTSGTANRSRCGMAAARNWVEVGPGPSLAVTKGRRQVGAVPLGPCALIATADPEAGAALATLSRALLTRGIPCTPWLDTQDPEADTAECAFRISLGRANAYSQRVLADFPEAASRLDEMMAEKPWAAVLVGRPDPEGECPDVPVLIVEGTAPDGIGALAEDLAAAIESDALRIPVSCDPARLAAPQDDYGVALINRGTPGASVEEDGTLVGLLCHTSPWPRNGPGKGKLERVLVPEHKSHVFEHALLPHQGDWRQGEVVRRAQESNNPLQAVHTPPGDGPLPPSFSFVSVDRPNLMVAAVKPVGNPVAEQSGTKRSDPAEGVVVRLYEAHGRKAGGQLTFGWEPQEAWLADLLERRVRDAPLAPAGLRRPAAVPVEVRPWGIETVACRLARPDVPAEGAAHQELGPRAEPYSPVYCRYWDHNLGPAPMGNQPVTLWMRGVAPPGRNTRFSLGISNDSADREISGTVRVLAPPEWQLIPRDVPYRVAPGSQAVYEVMVVVPADANPCFLRAVLSLDDVLLQDVMPIGEVAPLELSLMREQRAFALHLRNPNSDYIEGQTALITPVESWGSPVGSLALSAVTPRMHPFRLEAGEEKRLVFSTQRAASGLDVRPEWAVAKVMWYGNVQYVQEPA